MKRKVILIFMIFFMCLVGINGVFAENMENASDVSTLGVDYADEMISAGGSSSTVDSWTDLQADVVNNNISTIYLNGTNFHPSNQISFNHDVNIVGLEGSYVGYANWSSSSTYNYIPFLSDSNLNIVFENVTFQYLADNILIKVAGNGNYVFRNCVFTNINATGSHQSVIWLNSGTALIDNCTFINNNCSYGTVSNYNENSVDAVHMTVKDSTFSDNYAGVEPGCINNCGQLEVINSTFSDNCAVWWAGAIHTHIGANTEALLGLSLDDAMFSDEILSDWATEEEDGITEWGEIYFLFEAMGALELGNFYANELSYEEIEETLYDWLIYSNFKDTITIPKGYYKRGEDYSGGFLTLFNNLLLYHYDEENDCYVYFNEGEDDIYDIHEYYDYQSINLYNSLSFDGNGSVIDANNYIASQSNQYISAFNVCQDANFYPNGKPVKFNSTVKNFKFINFSSQSVLVDTVDTSIWDCINFVNCTFENFNSLSKNVLSRQNLGKFHFINCTFINLNCYLDCSNIIFDGCTFIDCLGISATSAVISNNTFYSNDFIFKIKPSKNFVFEDNYIVVNKSGKMYYGDYGAYVTEPIDSKYPYFNHVLLAGNYPLKTNITTSLEGSNLVFTLDNSDNGNLTLDDGTIIPISNGVGLKSIDKNPGESVEGTISGYLGEKYYALSSDYSLTVPKADPDFTIEVDSIFYNQSVPSVTINSDNDPDFNITVWDVTNTLVYNTTSKKGTINLKELAAGNYVVNVTSIEDTTYNSVSKTTALTVSQAETEITSTEVNDNNLVITLNNTLVNGAASVNINSIPYYADVVDGVITLDVSSLEPKEYVATVSYLGNTNFTAFTNEEITFTISDARTAPTISADDFIITEGDKALINVTITGATGDVVVIIGETKYLASLDGEGKATITVPGLTYGEVKANVNYTGDNNYLPANKTITITVNEVIPPERIDPKLELTVEETIIKVTLNSTATGDVIVTVGDISFISDAGEDITIDASEYLSNGTYDVKVTYAGDDVFANATKTGSVTVPEEPVVEPKDPGLNLSVDGTVIKVTINEDASGLVIVTVGDISFVFDAGELEPVDVSEYLGNGTYPVEVVYLGDDVFANATESGSVTVPEEAVVEPKDSELKVDIENTTITVTINDTATGDVIITVGDISFVFDVSELTPIDVSEYLGNGTYPVTVKYAGDDVFAEKTLIGGSVTVPEEEVIEPKDAGLKVDVKDTVITVSLNDTATGLVIISVGDISFVQEAGELAPIDVSEYLTNGTYPVEVIYLGDDVFANATETGSVTVPPEPIIEPKDPNLKATAVNTTVTATLDKDATGNILVNVDGKGYYAEIKDGKAVIDIAGLEAGKTYDATVTYAGDDIYANASATLSITVPKEETPEENETEPVTPTMTVKATNSTIEVTLPSNATGYVIVDVDGKGFYAKVSNGKATVEVAGLDAGKYTAAVTYLGDDNYLEATKSVDITIPEDETPEENETEPVTPTMTVKATNSTIEVTLPADATGYVIVDVDGKGFYAKVSNGKATVEVTGLDAGKYAAAVTYLGDDNYLEATKSVDITVPEDETPEENETEPVTPAMTAKATNNTIEVTLPSNATGNVIVDVGGKGYYAKVSNGKATVEVIGLDAGKYTAAVTYLGDDNYLEATKSVDITIPEDETPVENDTPVDANADIKVGNETVDVTLPEDATGYVLVDVDGKGYYAPVKDGKATVELPELDEGNHTVTVTYTGDDKYAPANATESVEIKKAIETVVTEDLIKIEKAPDRFVANFTDKDGKVLADTKVTFAINGGTYTRTTDANGQASFAVNLPAGNYTMVTTNPVTNETKENTIAVLSRFAENNDVTKYFRNDTQYVVKVLGDDGNIAAAGEIVTFNINGVFYNRTVNASGYAKLNINLNPDDYIITAEYKGCKVSNNIKVLPILTGKDLTKKFGEAGAFEATLVDGQGKAYANQKVEFNINGVFYSRTTNDNGVARLNINLQPGEYIITSTYGQAAISNKVTVTA